jgi:hypothetical protein
MAFPLRELASVRRPPPERFLYDSFLHAAAAVKREFDPHQCRHPRAANNGSVAQPAPRALENA